jgi:hypothetical protein
VDDGRSLRLRTAGAVIGVIGVMAAVATLVGGIAASNGDAEVAATVAWTFGLATMAFATVKLGIAAELAAILGQLWRRVDVASRTVPDLAPATEDTGREGALDTPYGRAVVTAGLPAPLAIHRMAKAMWAPMIAMGVMAVATGLVLSVIWAGSIGTDAEQARTLSAWVPGLQFLGEGMLLAGISFLLGTILYALRTGGGEVQHRLGLKVTTLSMPTTAKAFVALMATGLMVEIVQFVGYLTTIGQTDPVAVASRIAWLGPLREVGLGLLLSGIVLALATIAKVLGFQFWRLRAIVGAGR